MTDPAMVSLLEGKATEAILTGHYLDAFPDGSPMLMIGLDPWIWETLMWYCKASPYKFAQSMGDVIKNVTVQYSDNRLE